MYLAKPHVTTIHSGHSSGGRTDHLFSGRTESGHALAMYSASAGSKLRNSSCIWHVMGPMSPDAHAFTFSSGSGSLPAGVYSLGMFCGPIQAQSLSVTNLGPR